MKKNYRFRWIWLLLAGLAAILLLGGLTFPPQTDSTPFLHTQPHELTVGIGQVETLALWMENVHDLVGVEVYLGFEPYAVEVVDLVPTQAGIQVGLGAMTNNLTVTVNEVNNVLGTIDFIAQLQEAAAPLNGSGELMLITFRGKALGAATPLNLDSAVLTVLVNGAQTTSPFNWSPGAILVGDPVFQTETPTPSVTITLTPTPLPGQPSQTPTVINTAAVAQIVTPTRPNPSSTPLEMNTGYPAAVTQAVPAAQVPTKPETAATSLATGATPAGTIQPVADPEVKGTRQYAPLVQGGTGPAAQAPVRAGPPLIPWILAGGGAALVLVGAAFLILRRRRPAGDESPLL